MSQRKYCRFYIVRHGETEGNVKQILQGQSNSKLTSNGIDQADKLAKKLKNVRFDLAFSSDLDRAQKTAEIIIKPRKLKVETNKLLREMSFGKYEGWQTKKFDQEFALIMEKRNQQDDQTRMWHQSSQEIEIDGVAAKRMCGFLLKTAQNNPGKTILMVSHGAIMRVFLIYLGWAKYQQLPHGAIHNCSYAVIKNTNQSFQVIKTSKIETEKIN